MSRLTHLEHQIRDMLIFAKGETRLAECLEANSFFDSIKQAAEPILEKNNVECSWDIDVNEKNIMCNKEALVGACLNLINNSIESVVLGASSKKAAQLKLQVTLSEKGSEHIQLIVKDNGPGISSNLRQKVFEPFYTTKAQGTGLGLSVVQAVVKAHQGEFSIRSSKKGVSAFVQLPVYNSAHVSGDGVQNSIHSDSQE